MTKLILTIVISSFIQTLCSGQTECISHWSKNGFPNQKLDSILANVSLKKIDSLPCASAEKSTTVDYKWYIDFYNEQIGDYFSDATCVNVAQRFYKMRNVDIYDELKIIQFELPEESISKIKNRYGKGYDGYRFFKLKVLILYKFVIKGNNIYFISTESYHPGEKDSFLDRICKVFVNSKTE